MRFRSPYITLLILAVALFAQTAKAQTAISPSIFSPYTMYGLGRMNSPANLSSRVMGGVGVAFGNPYEINYLNPASLGLIRQRSALFAFGAEAQAYTSATTSKDIYGNQFTARSANLTANLHDVGLAIPLARGIGFSVALTPVSTIGYRSQVVDTSKQMIENVGRALYSYSGDGGVSAVTGSLGVRVSKGLTLGASLIYYFGSIDRYTNTQIIPLASSQSFASVQSLHRMNVSKISGAFGAQYAFRVAESGYLSIGATYQLQATMQAKTSQLTTQNTGASLDTVIHFEGKTPIKFPAKLAVGIAYQSTKLTLGFDYSRQNWKDAFQTGSTDIGLATQQEFRFGAAYTPNRMDIRSVLKRWTYKLGGQYSTDYITRNGKQLSSYSFSLGFDVPLNAKTFSKFSFGAEFGKQGTLGTVNESFAKVFFGITFFGDDMWFERRKFN